MIKIGEVKGLAQYIFEVGDIIKFRPVSEQKKLGLIYKKRVEEYMGEKLIVTDVNQKDSCPFPSRVDFGNFVDLRSIKDNKNFLQVLSCRCIPVFGVNEVLE
jgi:hypothetical protein